MSLCCKCHKTETGPRQKYCKPCHADNMREWRKSHPLLGESRLRMVCRSYARVYLKRGVIIEQGCQFEGCGKKAQMHHHDYNEPLLVVWLCRDHHLELHSDPRLEAQIPGLYAPLLFKKVTRVTRRLSQFTKVIIDRYAEDAA